MMWEKVTFGRLYAEPSRNGIYKSKQYHGSGTRIVNMKEIFAFSFIDEQEMNLLSLTDYNYPQKLDHQTSNA